MNAVWNAPAVKSDVGSVFNSDSEQRQTRNTVIDTCEFLWKRLWGLALSAGARRYGRQLDFLRNREKFL